MNIQQLSDNRSSFWSQKFTNILTSQIVNDLQYLNLLALASYQSTWNTFMTTSVIKHQRI